MNVALFGTVLFYILRLHEMFSLPDLAVLHDNDLTVSELMEDMSQLDSNGRRTIRQVTENQKCRRVNWTVDFNTTIWKNYMVSPRVTNLYSCQGDCNYPLNWTDYTNHSMMQSYSNRYEQPQIRRPCCVPTILSTLDITYRIGGSTINSTLVDMVVEQCGCL